ncbi:hypothetical protein Cni_G09228 [Canna indica]|uniref:AAA+ ATPase domain-containing protein n=1 Tax=Canna indica TaxID=4628 RepID=A0AAQ3K3Y0_9LILI|nr:hypothetical protein Cni_G09228 [Canna indica]
MYTRRLKCRIQRWDSLHQEFWYLSKSIRKGNSRGPYNRCDTCIEPPLRDSPIRKFSSVSLSPWRRDVGMSSRFNPSIPYACCRLYSSEGDGSNASGGKHVPVKGAANIGNENMSKEEAVFDLKNRCNEHAWLGEQDQLDWLNSEKLSIDSKRKESPFLTKRQRLKKEFMRRVVPWEKIKVSWDKFPYHICENTKNLLVECVATHLKHKNLTSTYGGRLVSSTGRILLQGFPGTELYRERMVRALARDLQVHLLVLDSNVLAPNDFGRQFASESDTDDGHVESGEECTSESDAEDENDESNEEWTSSNEAKSGESDDDDVQASAEALKKLVPCSLEEFAKTVAGEIDGTSTSAEPEAGAVPEQSKRPLKKGDRVKYVGSSVHNDLDKRIILGKIPTSEGSTNAFTFVSGRSLSTGQRGEVCEINGDQVAVIVDNPGNKLGEGNSESANEQDTKPSIHWVDIQDIVHDLDTQAEEWYIAMEALCEILPPLQPTIVYFPDCSQWLSRAVPKSNRQEFIEKVEQMFNQIPGPVVFICGQNIMESGSKEKEKLTMVLPGLGRVARLPLALKRLTEGLGASKSSKDKDIYKLFTNVLYIHPPEEEEQLRIFNKQIDEDRRIIISRNNLIELHKVLGEHELSCMDLLHVKTDGVFLTKQKAEKVAGWAKNHYLSSSLLPSIKGDRLMIPSESLDIAITRLKEKESIFKKPSQSLATITKDEFEKNFVSALIPPEEIGVKFDDIGALEDVKKTLNELVSLPMRRPELFSRGNLLRPCKGVLLFGPPGTGKTLLAKALATEAGANFINITSSSLTSKWFGDAEKLTKALFSFASRLAPVIIFIDEVDSLLGARGGAFEHEATRRIRNEFMAAWDGLKTKDSQRILVLAATNRPFDLDDAVIRRLPRRIYVGLPDVENRTKILRVLLSQENLEPDFNFDQLANATDGYSGSDLKNLCIAAAYRPVEELLEEERKRGRSDTTSSLRPLKMDDFIEAKSKVSASVAYDATSMNDLRQWNDQYGEGGSRTRSPFGFGSTDGR